MPKNKIANNKNPLRLNPGKTIILSILPSVPDRIWPEIHIKPNSCRKQKQPPKKQTYIGMGLYTKPCTKRKINLGNISEHDTHRQRTTTETPPWQKFAKYSAELACIVRIFMDFEKEIHMDSSAYDKSRAKLFGLLIDCPYPRASKDCPLKELRSQSLRKRMSEAFNMPNKEVMSILKHHNICAVQQEALVSPDCP